MFRLSRATTRLIFFDFFQPQRSTLTSFLLISLDLSLLCKTKSWTRHSCKSTKTGQSLPRPKLLILLTQSLDQFECMDTNSNRGFLTRRVSIQLFRPVRKQGQKPDTKHAPTFRIYNASNGRRNRLIQTQNTDGPIKSLSKYYIPRPSLYVESFILIVVSVKQTYTCFIHFRTQNARILMLCSGVIEITIIASSPSWPTAGPNRDLIRG